MKDYSKYQRTSVDNDLKEMEDDRTFSAYLLVTGIITLIITFLLVI